MGKCSEETHELAHQRGEGGWCSYESVSVKRNLAKLLSSSLDVLADEVPSQVINTGLRISFDDISLCNYRIIFKISLKYRYRQNFENITRY